MLGVLTCTVSILTATIHTSFRLIPNDLLIMAENYTVCFAGVVFCHCQTYSLSDNLSLSDLTGLIAQDYNMYLAGMVFCHCQTVNSFNSRFIRGDLYCVPFRRDVLSLSDSFNGIVIGFVRCNGTNIVLLVSVGIK
jgi:hypothetical protein